MKTILDDLGNEERPQEKAIMPAEEPARRIARILAGSTKEPPVRLPLHLGAVAGYLVPEYDHLPQQGDVREMVADLMEHKMPPSLIHDVLPPLAPARVLKLYLDHTLANAWNTKEVDGIYRPLPLPATVAGQTLVKAFPLVATAADYIHHERDLVTIILCDLLGATEVKGGSVNDTLWTAARTYTAKNMPRYHAEFIEKKKPDTIDGVADEIIPNQPDYIQAACLLDIIGKPDVIRDGYDAKKIWAEMNVKAPCANALADVYGKIITAYHKTQGTVDGAYVFTRLPKRELKDGLLVRISPEYPGNDTYAEYQGKVGTLKMCDGCGRPSDITFGRKQCHIHDNEGLQKYIDLATPFEDDLPTKLTPAGYTSVCSTFEFELTKEQYKTFAQIRRELEDKSGITDYFKHQRTNDLVRERLELIFGQQPN